MTSPDSEARRATGSWSLADAAGATTRLAIALRRLDLPPLKRYAWEDERDVDEDQDKEK